MERDKVPPTSAPDATPREWLDEMAEEIANESLRVGERAPRTKYGWIGMERIREIVDRHAAAERSRVRSYEWHDCRKGLPPENTNVLIACYSMNGKWVQASYLIGRDRWSQVEGGVDVRYWQHIPPAPERSLLAKESQ